MFFSVGNAWEVDTLRCWLAKIKPWIWCCTTSPNVNQTRQNQTGLRTIVCWMNEENLAQKRSRSTQIPDFRFGILLRFRVGVFKFASPCIAGAGRLACRVDALPLRSAHAVVTVGLFVTDTCHWVLLVDVLTDAVAVTARGIWSIHEFWRIGERCMYVTVNLWNQGFREITTDYTWNDLIGESGLRLGLATNNPKANFYLSHFTNSRVISRNPWFRRVTVRYTDVVGETCNVSVWNCLSGCSAYIELGDRTLE